MRKNIIAGILEHVRINALGNLLTEDGTPNTSAIRRLGYIYIYLGIL